MYFTNKTGNKNIRFLLCFLIFIILSGAADAQSRRRSKEPKVNIWKEKMWYGGGFNLGFNSSIYNGLQSSVFGIGISPMAGYKFNHVFSVGPRFSIDFTTAKFSDGFETYRFNSLDYGLGVFARAKFLTNLFAHFEYSQLNETFTTGSINSNGELEKFRQWRDLLILGLGYTSGGIWAYEIYINYDFLEDPESFRVPIVYRAGISYKF